MQAAEEDAENAAESHPKGDDDKSGRKDSVNQQSPKPKAAARRSILKKPETEAPKRRYVAELEEKEGKWELQLTEKETGAVRKRPVLCLFCRTAIE